MATREEFGQFLREFSGITNVYFQAPEGVRMRYPAIRYSLSGLNNTFADDDVYLQKKNYEVIVIDEDPDSEIAERFNFLRNCRFVRSYPAEGLNHFVYQIYH